MRIKSILYSTMKSRLWFKYVSAGCGQPSKERQSGERITFVKYILLTRSNPYSFSLLHYRSGEEENWRHFCCLFSMNIFKCYFVYLFTV